MRGLKPWYPITAAIFQNIQVNNRRSGNPKRTQRPYDVANGLLILGIYKKKRGKSFLLFRGCCGIAV